MSATAHRNRRHVGRPKPHGFSLIELLVVIGIIATLVALLLPSLRNAKEFAIGAKCRSVLKGWGSAVHLYATDFDGVLPFYAGACPAGKSSPGATWFVALPPYLGRSELSHWTPEAEGELTCPKPPNNRITKQPLAVTGSINYGISLFNRCNAFRLSFVNKPETKGLIGETYNYWINFWHNANGAGQHAAYDERVDAGRPRRQLHRRAHPVTGHARRRTVLGIRPPNEADLPPDVLTWGFARRRVSY
jgi:prepilin-type N-terminal cleavage/methylation domain-containing protein